MSAEEHTHARLVALERDWSAAIVANDPDRIGSFLTDDWVIVSGQGVGTRAEFLGHVRSGDLTHSAMRDTGPLRVRVYGDAGDTAVVTGRMTNTAFFRGQRFDADEWVTDLFVRREGLWRCALTHITAADPG
ncbi:nuclear transport factor 2 family protein [Nocardiopsis sp. NRRL B-16309]|uniref:nuclear transport factor 2 family protein n=1 Tax=Nocardiopsis sp. NRRL B-16309 TaxID=1519494 RepID=UPI0006B016AA|nr:nuclear transport factor 2 family protein [Nocardiopsis sp. NRRL B-16309]KOX13211.1 SnoaL_3 multi-domain protein [Nocardiopsis sp. NRRL B-16309]